MKKQYFLLIFFCINSIYSTCTAIPEILGSIAHRDFHFKTVHRTVFF